MGAPTKRKREGDAGRVKNQRRLETIMDGAAQLDRRRQAQIRNQRESIDRLLARFDEHKCNPIMDPHALMVRHLPVSSAVYGEEMQILHEGSAALAADLESMRDVLRRLVSAFEATSQFGRDTVMTVELADALSVARSWLGSVSG